jgi:cell division protein FtsW
MTQYETPYLEAGEPVKTDLWLWLIPLILSGFGILMVTSTTSNFVYDVSGTPFTMGIRQVRSLGLGFIVMLVITCIPIRFWYNIATTLWVTSVIMLAATMIPGIGSSAGGASRWIRVGGISVQPSEIMILAVVLEMGKIFDKRSDNSKSGFTTMLALIFITAVPLLKQPDLGSTIFLALVCMGMFVERFGWGPPLAMGLVCGALFLLLIFIEPYRLVRLKASLDPFSDPLGSGFQIIQGLVAFSNGGILGTGLGHGFQKLQYLPAAYTDYIYAALGEELGLAGTISILALAALWLLRCRFLYKRVATGFEASVVWGITLTIILPFFINIGGVTNLIPLTGMPLPFMSYGGSSLVMSWVRIGILLRLQKDISREART